MKQNNIHPDLVALTDIKSHIAKITGVLLDDKLIKKYIKKREIVLFCPYKRGVKYTTKKCLNEFIKKHTAKESKIDSELTIYAKFLEKK